MREASWVTGGHDGWWAKIRPTVPAALLGTALVCGGLAGPAVVAVSAPAAPRRAPVPADARGRVVLPSGRVLEVEVADTDEKRRIGYMFRKKISSREGMVFLMETLGFHPFWMKNCEVGLDILWLDETWKVVHIERRVPPCSQDPCPSYTPMQASLYVLEVREGLSEKEGVKVGDRITFVPPG